VEKADVLLVVDMQQGLLAGSAKWDRDGLVSRINWLSGQIRRAGGSVIFVRHTRDSEALAAGSPGWQLLPDLHVEEGDAFLSKSTCDCFAGTDLFALQPPALTGRLIITGFATEFCVDTTVRSAAVRGYDVWAPEDGHTTADRPHLSAEQVRAHHNYVWSGFIGARGAINTDPISDIR
jgi:nicotinamidase-related amidase